MRMEIGRAWTRAVARWVPTMVLLAVTTLIALGSSNGGQVRSAPNNDAFCGKYQTTQVTFRNTSHETTYDLVWDGAYIGVIQPGESRRGTVAAGHHRVDFKFPNSVRSAYFEDDTVLAACSSVTFSCGRDE
jgi:hypothetical protein